MTIDFSSWGWPQWTYAISYVVLLLVAAIENGKPKTGTYNFATSLVVAAIYVAILGFGGFWS